MMEPENIQMSTCAEILNKIQAELKAPKNQFNSFGKYNYRSCEDILEGLKPLLAKHNAVLTLSDEIVNISNRYYVKALARLRACKDHDEIITEAYARETERKKGMDESQITGSASSYARKYALNGLFCIDDTKDADTGKPYDTEKIEIDLNKYFDAIQQITNVEDLNKWYRKNKAMFESTLNKNQVMEIIDFCTNHKNQIEGK